MKDIWVQQLMSALHNSVAILKEFDKVSATEEELIRLNELGAKLQQSLAKMYLDWLATVFPESTIVPGILQCDQFCGGQRGPTF